MPFGFYGNVVRRAIGFRLFSSLAQQRIQLTTPFWWQRVALGNAAFGFLICKYELIYAHEYYVSVEAYRVWKMAASTDGDEWDHRKAGQIVLMSYFNSNGFSRIQY